MLVCIREKYKPFENIISLKPKFNFIQFDDNNDDDNNNKLGYDFNWKDCNDELEYLIQKKRCEINVNYIYSELLFNILCIY